MEVLNSSLTIENHADGNIVHFIEPLSLKKLSENKVEEGKQKKVLKAADDINFALCESEESTPSEGNTPREDYLSSGSPSPVPDEHGNPEKPKFRLGKDISMMMQALNSLNSPEEKIAALCKKYADLLCTNKIQQKKLKVTQRKQAALIHENLQLEADLNKSFSMKSKLENIARELQNQNKALRREYDAKLDSMAKGREQICDKLKKNFDDITTRMSSLSNANTALSHDKKRLLNEFTNREKIFETMIKQHEEHNELLKLKVEKGELLLQKEKQQNATEQLHMAKQENELRQQLQDYSEKFEDFEGTLKKSNSVFSMLMEKISAFEKSEVEWQNIQKNTAKKMRRLEELCRAMQTERTDLVDKVKAYEMVQKPVTRVSNKKDRQSKRGKDAKKNQSKIHTTEDLPLPKAPLSPKVSPIDQNQQKITSPQATAAVSDSPLSNTPPDIASHIKDIVEDIVDVVCANNASSLL